ncbi:hypothetical protein ER308_09305 [Egibacter rhizosphaerae]|uniref:Uncharacterized protein n=1 Tax=Egibacter rhizosphaerae TaxID=1670831 RepID=A0A411YEV2_9ACTN|nr:hypothetical protein [Egibacter rhizosphaerae]QBI19726.1 hypothetical protein ER308_09305 [Egibacter rhizosphaerae]
MGLEYETARVRRQELLQLAQQRRLAREAHRHGPEPGGARHTAVSAVGRARAAWRRLTGARRAAFSTRRV